MRRLATLAVLLAALSGTAAGDRPAPGSIDRSWGDRGTVLTKLSSVPRNQYYSYGVTELVRDGNRVVVSGGAGLDDSRLPALVRYRGDGSLDPGLRARRHRPWSRHRRPAQLGSGARARRRPALRRGRPAGLRARLLVADSRGALPRRRPARSALRHAWTRLAGDRPVSAGAGRRGPAGPERPAPGLGLLGGRRRRPELARARASELDPTFGAGNGWTRAPEYPSELTVQPDGKLLVSGLFVLPDGRIEEIACPDKPLLVRYLPNGKPDLSLGRDGSRDVDGVQTCLYDVALTPRGQLVGGTDAGVVRLDLDGNVDPASATAASHGSRTRWSRCSSSRATRS